MKLEFYNCPKPIDIASIALPPEPEFILYRPDFELMKKLASEYGQYPNILIIGHGGSITSFYGFYHALKEQVIKKVYFLSTVDPDYIFELRQKLNPQNTLVIAISKSGETTTQIEALNMFVDFPLLIITGKSSSLRAIGEKLNAKIILHPIIGGRYTGFTEVGLLPAALCGLDAEKLFNAAEAFYRLYRKDNLAWKTASVLFQLEQKGFVDVFMPFYSRALFAMSNVIVQLCHESFGKEGKGQTYFAHEAPESQHHTNQRFFGGIKNICGIFTTVNQFNHPTQNVFATGLLSVQVKGHHLADISKVPLEKAMEFEAAATMENARISGIPLLHLSVEGFSPSEIGQLLAFWQLFAVYSSLLRNVDPFDQPQVEASKSISFNKRLAFKGLT